MFALLGKSIFFLFLRSLCGENGKCFLEIKWQTVNFEQKIGDISTSRAAIIGDGGLQS